MPTPVKLTKPKEKFNTTQIINEKCQEKEFVPDENGRCKDGQTEICILESPNKWKMSTCKLDGLLNPVTGRCDCSPKTAKKTSRKRMTRNSKHKKRENK